MARPVGKIAPKSWRGPDNKLIWTLDDQRQAVRYGFFVGVRIELNESGYGKQKFERAAINRAFPGLLGKLTKEQFLDMFNQGRGKRDPFWLKLSEFLHQQTTHGYVGAWDAKARTMQGVRNAERAERLRRATKIVPIPQEELLRRDMEHALRGHVQGDALRENEVDIDGVIHVVRPLS